MTRIDAIPTGSSIDIERQRTKIIKKHAWRDKQAILQSNIEKMAAFNASVREKEERKRVPIMDNETYLFDNNSGEAVKVAETNKHYGNRFIKNKKRDELIPKCGAKVSHGLRYV